MVRGLSIATRPGAFDDPDNYLVLARSLAAGQGLSYQGRLTAYRPPLYPVLLAPLVSAFDGRWLPVALGMLHLTLAGLTVVLVAATARRWGQPGGVSLVAAGIVAFDPVLVVQSRSVMTETLAAALVALSLFVAAGNHRYQGFWTGLTLGLAALCRPSLLPAAGLAAVTIGWSGPGPWRDRLGRSGILLLGTTLVLAPWMIRNHFAVGGFVATTTHGGYTLALGNNPTYYREVLDGPPGVVWSGPGQVLWQEEVARSVAGLTEPEADRRIAASARKLARDRPATFARACLARVGRFWGVAPAASVYSRPVRIAVAVWTVPLWILVAVGLLRRDLWRWPAVLAPGLVATLAAVHVVYWTDMRMRAPVVPALALIAAPAIVPILAICRRPGVVRRDG